MVAAQQLTLLNQPQNGQIFNVLDLIKEDPETVTTQLDLDNENEVIEEILVNETGIPDEEVKALLNDKTRLAKLQAIKELQETGGVNVDRICAKYFEKGLAPYKHTNIITGKTYSNGNTWELEISALINNFKTFEWATFNQFSNNEYRIKKGSKSTKICVAIYNKSKDDEEKENLKYFTGASVFNKEQAEKLDSGKSENRKKILKAVEKDISEMLKTPEAQADLAEVKEIQKFENKLSKNCASLSKKIKQIKENLRTKKTHTRRMMHQYESKLFELNVAEFWYNLQTNLLNKGVLMSDIKMFEFIKENSYKLISIRFNSDRYYEFTDGKPYCFHNANTEKEKQAIVDAYNWIEKNLKADPEAERLKKIDEAERKAKNLHGKIDGFHSTPKELAKKLVKYADITHGAIVLEPSAGIGGIADMVREEIKENCLKDVQIHVCEVNYTLREVLGLKDYDFASSENDFLKREPVAEYDAIIMNPPFENGLDTEHIQHAFKFLKNGGKLIAVMSASTMHKSTRKFVDFQEFVCNNGGYTEKVEAGTFKESRTMVASEILIMRKG